MCLISSGWRTTCPSVVFRFLTVCVVSLQGEDRAALSPTGNQAEIWASHWDPVLLLWLIVFFFFPSQSVAFLPQLRGWDLLSDDQSENRELPVSCWPERREEERSAGPFSAVKSVGYSPDRLWSLTPDVLLVTSRWRCCCCPTEPGGGSCCSSSGWRRCWACGAAQEGEGWAASSFAPEHTLCHTDRKMRLLLPSTHDVW